jgi:hypothetical protein
MPVVRESWGNSDRSEGKIIGLLIGQISSSVPYNRHAPCFPTTSASTRFRSVTLKLEEAGYFETAGRINATPLRKPK